MNRLDYTILIFATLLCLTLFKMVSDVTKLNTKANIERILTDGK